MSRADLIQESTYKDMVKFLAGKVNRLSSKDISKMNLGIRKKLYLIDLYLQTNGERLFGSEFEFKLNGPLDV